MTDQDHTPAAQSRRVKDDPGTALLRVQDDDNPADEDEDEDQPSGPLAELRFLHEGATCWDVILFAREAALSTPSEGRTKGKWRMANIVYAYSVCRLGLALVYLFAWAFLMRLDRALKSAGVVVALAVVGNRIPVVEVLVFWDWADPTTWAWVRWFFAFFSPDPAPAAPPAGAVE